MHFSPNDKSLQRYIAWTMYRNDASSPDINHSSYISLKRRYAARSNIVVVIFHWKDIAEKKRRAKSAIYRRYLEGEARYLAITVFNTFVQYGINEQPFPAAWRSTIHFFSKYKFFHKMFTCVLRGFGSSVIRTHTRLAPRSVSTYSDAGMCLFLCFFVFCGLTSITCWLWVHKPPRK